MICHVILDTGPLVAFLVAGEVAHDWTVARLGEIQRPLLTCEPVLTEACFLLQQHAAAISQIHEFLKHRVIEIPFDLATHHDRVFNLWHSYRNVPMSLADACLVRMSETIPDSRVFTLDSDFRVYRQHGRRQIPLIIP